MTLKYSEKMIKHFENPKHAGELKDADGIGTVGNPICGDLMTIYIKVKDNKIADISFKTFGCASAIATTDMICNLAKGVSIEKAEKITKQDVVDGLEGLPPIKIHCSNLADEALRAAILDYKTKKQNPHAEHKSRIRLSCKGVNACCARTPAP